MRKQFSIAMICLFLGNVVLAQKHITDFHQAWFAYANQTRFTDKWGVWADFHLRTKEDFFTDLNQSIVRVGLTYYLNNNVKLTNGYAYINNFPGDNHKNISQPEHRIWQQIQWHNNYPRLRLMQWVRLEERFRRKIVNDDLLGEGYDYSNRVRYNFFLSAPLSKNAFMPKTISFVFNDELHINFGKQVVYNSFDQNRFFLGFSYHTNAQDNLQFGYLNVFQQLATGNNYKNIHAARITYFHNLDLRKKNK